VLAVAVGVSGNEAESIEAGTDGLMFARDWQAHTFAIQPDRDARAGGTAGKK